MIKGLLSDLDGTLVDTEHLYYSAYSSCAAHYGKSWSPQQHTQHLLGKPQTPGIAAFLAALQLTDSVTHEQVVQQRDAILLPAFASVALLPGAAAAVAAAKAAGLRCGIVTSSRRHMALLKTAPHAAFLANFEVIVCHDDELVAGKPGKPAPDHYVAAAAALGLLPSECMVWEDSLMGITAGVAAGCRVVAVPDSRIPLQEVHATGCSHVLTSLEHFSMQLLVKEEV